MAWSKKGNQVNGVEVTSVEFENQGGMGITLCRDVFREKYGKQTVSSDSQLRQSLGGRLRAP